MPARSARFNSPGGIAVDTTGIVYVADTFNHCIRKIDTDTQRTVSTLAGSIGNEGMLDGAATLARFRYPTGLALTADGSLVVADMFNHRVRRIAIGSGQVSTVAGSSAGDRDGPGNVARFSYPSAVAVDNKGVIYVVSTHAAKVKAIMPDQEHSVMSIAGTIQGYADGPAFSSRIGAQGGIIFNAGELLVSDAANLRVRQITLDAADASNSTIETLAGSGRFGNVDGMGSQAEFGLPLGLAVAADGTIYVADAANGTIRRIHR